MSDFWIIIALAALPGAGNLLGGIMAELWQPSQRLLNWALHAASGIIIAVVAVEIMPAALRTIGGHWIAAAFLVGAMSYLVLAKAIDMLTSRGEVNGGPRSSMWMVYAAIAIDLSGDGLLVGSGTAISFTLALALAVGQIIADVPEGYAAVANFRSRGLSRSRRLLLASSFLVFTITTALLSYAALRGAPSSIKISALVFTSGMLTVAAVEDILNEAHAARDDGRRSVLAFAGGFALFILVSAGLEAAVSSTR